MKNPWLITSGCLKGCITLDGRDRLESIKTFSRAELQAAIHVPGVQKTVRLAAERRLNKLNSSIRNRKS